MATKKGGVRPGAGRKLKFAEPTKPIRVPISRTAEVIEFLAVTAHREQEIANLHFVTPAEAAGRLELPLFATGIRAGFPSPAADFMESRLDLNDLIQHKEATFYAWCEGDSMIGLGIQDGDLLVIDKAVEAEMGDIIVAEMNAEFTVKRLGTHLGKPHLLPANPDFAPIPIPPDGVSIWGVVIRVIHDPRPRVRRKRI